MTVDKFRRASKDRHYVDKKRMYEDLKTWYPIRKAAVAEGRDPPDPPRYVSECLLKIVYGMATKNNFKNYTYVDEMIADGLENVVVALSSFNPDKSDNPFGYFSIVVFYAFVRRIAKEKRQTYIKYKVTEQMSLTNDLEKSFEHGESSAIKDILENDKMMTLVRKIEEPLGDPAVAKGKKKKIKPQPKGLDKNSPFWRRQDMR